MSLLIRMGFVLVEIEVSSLMGMESVSVGDRLVEVGGVADVMMKRGEVDEVVGDDMNTIISEDALIVITVITVIMVIMAGMADMLLGDEAVLHLHAHPVPPILTVLLLPIQMNRLVPFLPTIT